MPALERWRQNHKELKVLLCYKVSEVKASPSYFMRPAWKKMKHKHKTRRHAEGRLRGKGNDNTTGG